jgi:hypothetical protein
VADTDRASLRFATAVALALALAYGMAVPLAFLAPLFAVFLGATPGPPPAPKQLVVLLLVMILSLGVGLLLAPVLIYYPVAGVGLVLLGLFLANYLALVAGKRIPGMFLIIGFTFISVAGTLGQGLAQALIVSLALNLVLAVVCLWLAYAVFPSLPPRGLGAAQAAAEQGEGRAVSSWLALRAALVILPAYLLALTNPSQYLMTIMKSVSLGQQASSLALRDAGRELIGSTFTGGIMAVLFWSLLKLWPNLWMFALWMAAFALFTAAKMQRLLPSRHPPSFWVNALVTMLILLGPAVQDSANGKDALTGFLVRFTTFVGVTLYAWLAIAVLENWRRRRGARAVAAS